MHVSLTDFLTKEQIQQAKKIFDKEKTPTKTICGEIIKPNLTKINQKLGQENDPMYLSYACEYIFGLNK